MIDIAKVDLTSPGQKMFAVALAIGTLILLYFLLPPLIYIFANLWLLAILALPVIYVIMNPMVVWNVYKQLSWNLTKKLISQDKLGFMYRYHEYLLGKIVKLDTNIQSVSAMRVKLTRKVSELKQAIEDNKAKAVAMQKQGASKLVIATIANKVTIDTKQLEALLPKVVNIESQEKFLRELYDGWKADTEDLKYTLDAKAEEYKLLKELSEVSGNASEFLKGDSEEYKLYQESLVQIENSVTQYTANIENFEKKVTPILETISANRTVNEDVGLQLIEEYKKTRVDLKLEDK